MRTILSNSILAFFLLVAAPLFGQEILSDAMDSEAITVEQIESAIAAIESRQSLDADIRGTVIEYLLDAQVQIQNRDSAAAAAKSYAESLKTAPGEMAKLRSSLDEEPPATPTLESFGIDENTTLAELEQRLAQETADLTDVESQMGEFKARGEIELDRPSLIRDQIDQLRDNRDELAEIVATPQGPGEQQIVSNARNLSAQLTRAAQSAEINRLEQELLSHSVRVGLLQAQRDVAARELLVLNARVTLLRDALNEKIQAAAIEAQETAAAAELAVAGKHPLLRELAEDNASLTRELPERAAATQELQGQLARTETELSDIQQRLDRSEQRLDIGGLSRALGGLLIAESRSLPPLSQYRADIRARDRESARVGLERIRVQEQRRELAAVDQAVQDLIAEMAIDASNTDALESDASEIRQLLLTRRELLLQVENSYASYLQVLANLDTAQRSLLDSTEEYQQFLAKNLLWIPSAPIFGMGLAESGLPDYPQALQLHAWAEVASKLVRSVGEHNLGAVACLVLLLALLLLIKPLARQDAAMSEKVGRLSSDNIGITVASLAIAAVRVLPLPILAYSIGWFLQNASQPTAFSDAVARCLIVTTPFLFNVLLFRVLSVPDGILNVHFGWQPKNTAVIRQQLQRLAFIGTPLLFATALLFMSESQSDRATVGRTLFIAFMIFLASVVRPILHPETGIVAVHYKQLAGTWRARLPWVWFALGFGLPLLLVVLSGLGFVYTSTMLAGSLVDTLWRVLGLIVLYLVVLRWLALARRKLALQIAIKDRDARRAERQNEEDAEEHSEVAPVAEVALDLDEVDQQTKKLLRSIMVVVALVVCWNIWVEILPAFSFLNDVGLWTQTATVEGVEVILPVTLADLLLAVLIIIATAIATRNLPGLMEIVILQRLTLAPGSRYAINTLVRYVIITIGTFSVLSLIGWNWSQIQWLVAALSVGLGFGLQEIVANFVSGLIILFERPVRVGDTVTVGQLTGTVSRVRIRATTITDWDRKEILVPNKSFITEQVINWTLSDPITRAVIPVGVAYDSDVDVTHQVISDILKSSPLVLDEPPPKVYFTGFGDYSLNFTLHAYLRQLSDRLPMVHEVHESILRALRDKGIEIPYPQRDIHIRSTVEDN